MCHQSDCRGRNRNNCCICICIYKHLAGADPNLYAVNLQLVENPAVGCRYFLPSLQLPFQRPSFDWYQIILLNDLCVCEQISQSRYKEVQQRQDEAETLGRKSD